MSQDRPILGMRPWTPGQRRGSVMIGCVLAMIVVVQLSGDRVFVSDPAPAIGARAGELLDGVDLNTASAATIDALPLLGARRARQIVEYRDRQQQAGNPRPFGRAEDLLALRGIGFGIVDQVRPYLRFTGPTTAPSMDR